MPARRSSHRHRVLAGAAGVLLALACLATPGCRHTSKRCAGGDALVGRESMEDYRTQATTIDEPIVCCAAEEGVNTLPPRLLADSGTDDVVDLPLEECIAIALDNNPIVRTRGQFRRAGSRPLAGAVSRFDPAIQETEVQFGRRGVEASLAEFDAQLATSMIWGRDERVQNLPLSGLAAGDTLTEETGRFRTALTKQMAHGGRFSMGHDVDYSLNNVPTRLFGSAYQGDVFAEYRHPLLAGAGTDFTRIAGPVLRQNTLQGVTSTDRGVVIARIRSDIALADFELAIRNMLRDTEELYWDLHLSYLVYDAEVRSRDAAHRTWMEVAARAGAGLGGGAAADEAQARDNYLEARSRAENALSAIYNAEAELRRILGLPVNDGRVLRPTDSPTVDCYSPDWCLALGEALTRRAELRRTKWELKSLELQRRAAKNLVKPQLDFVSRYQVNAFGDTLLDNTTDDGTGRPRRNLYGNLAHGDETSWNLGAELTMPIGFRAANTQVRNIELRLARTRAMLASQEHDISHELAAAFRELDRAFTTTRTNLARREAARQRVDAFRSDYDAGRLKQVDLLLRAQISLAQAEVAAARAIVDYNKAIVDVHFTKSTLLDYDGVHLAESDWAPGAYDDALQRAVDRARNVDAPILRSDPEPFAVPAVSNGPAMSAPIGSPVRYEEIGPAESSPTFDAAPLEHTPVEHTPVDLGPAPEDAPPSLAPVTTSSSDRSIFDDPA